MGFYEYIMSEFFIHCRSLSAKEPLSVWLFGDMGFYEYTMSEFFIISLCA